MATYKVPQDVEADDKLIGPFSFRQFIFLLVGIGGLGLAYFLSTIAIPLLIIPLPISILAIILSLPLKKDQPMEIYLAAILSYHLKPKKRLWKQDGIGNMVEITYENIASDIVQLKDLSFNQAQERLKFLADVADTDGWAVKGVNKSNIKQDIINEANQITDINDSSDAVNQAFNEMINHSNEQYKQNVIKKMNQAKNFTTQYSINNQPIYNSQPAPYQNPQNIQNRPINNQPTQFTQNPNYINQQPNFNEQNTNQKPNINPELISLANNEDLTIETISSQANKIVNKNNDAKILSKEGEISISLR